jgi:hypothetical protein
MYYLVIEDVDGASDPAHVRVRSHHEIEPLRNSMRDIALHIAWYRRVAIYVEDANGDVYKDSTRMRRVDSRAGGWQL